MKRISLALTAAAVVVALAGINQGAMAQTGPGAGMGMGPKKGAGTMQKMDPAERLKRMEVRLGLSEEQKGKIAPILEEEAKEMKALGGDTTLTRTQKREKMKEISDRYHGKIGEHLTPEQQQKADEMRKMATERMKDRPKTAGKARKGAGTMQKMDPAERLKRLDARLGLSEDQKGKIVPILEEETKEMKALRDDTTLTRTQKREKMKEIRDRYHGKIGEHLTPEQQQKANEMRERAKERWDKRKKPMTDRPKPAGEVQ